MMNVMTELNLIGHVKVMCILVQKYIFMLFWLNGLGLDAHHEEITLIKKHLCNLLMFGCWICWRVDNHHWDTWFLLLTCYVLRHVLHILLSFIYLFFVLGQN